MIDLKIPEKYKPDGQSQTELRNLFSSNTPAGPHTQEAKKVLAGQSEFSGHRLEARGMFLSVVETEMSFVSPSLIEY
jgi:hypothetical protein